MHYVSAKARMQDIFLRSLHIHFFSLSSSLNVFSQNDNLETIIFPKYKNKIDYIKDLGVDAIYLNPIFKSNSSHRYDTIDYMAIDPLLGTDEDFRELVDTCHNNGIKVILDLVFNHSSTQFFAFQDLLKNQEKSITKIT